MSKPEEWLKLVKPGMHLKAHKEFQDYSQYIYVTSNTIYCISELIWKKTGLYFVIYPEAGGNYMTVGSNIFDLDFNARIIHNQNYDIRVDDLING